MKKTPGKQPLTPDQFTNDPDVIACVNELKKKFGDDYKKLTVSDTYDDQGHQYVNLVQKGGGVLGIALVGYTYILEQAGIRFLRMAGTSAGAINTALLTAIGNKEDAKSPKLLQYLCDLDFFSLVDGDRFVRLLTRTFITHKDFAVKVKLWATIIASTFLAFVIGDFVFWLLGKRDPAYYPMANVCVTVTGFMMIAIALAGAYAGFLRKRLIKENYGLNPGDVFYKWVKDRLEENGVKTVADLNSKASQHVALNVRKPETQDPSTLFGDVTFITSELVSGNKIEFPRMAKLFRADPNDLHPAEFVRSSMSIPFFFQSHIITDIKVDDPIISNEWKETFLIDDVALKAAIPVTARFVDGGILSNFPISIFYNPDIIVPRLPSFGIDLDDGTGCDATGQDAQNWPLAKYLGNMFNTVRSYYDKDFLIKNSVLEKGIGKISLAEFNWLNFFLSDDDKKQMFIRGAQTAKEFLLNFNWDDYQKNRAKIQVTLNSKNKKTTEKAVY